IEHAEVEAVIIDPALPTQLAAPSPAPGHTARPVRFTGYEPVSPQAAAQWRTAYDYVRDTVVSIPHPADQPLVAASAPRLLAATALAVFPTDAVPAPTTQDSHDGHPGTVRRAVEFIDENAHQDISVADIAAAAFVTIRAVQLAFRRHLDTTPMRYL